MCECKKNDKYQVWMIVIFATWILNGLASIISYNKSLVITIMRKVGLQKLEDSF